MDLNGLGSALAALGTFAGVWGVVFLFRWLQRDVFAVYRLELAAERKLREIAELGEDRERRARFRSDLRVAMLEELCVRHGIEIPPKVGLDP